MNDPQRDWIRNRATGLESRSPEVPLTPREQQAVDRIVGDAAVIALGEAMHGERETLQARERILWFLVEERRVTAIVMEADFGSSRRLNDFVVSGVGTAAEALTAAEYWSCVNEETLGLLTWVRRHNLSAQARGRAVRVYGCDLQSLDGPVDQIRDLLRRFARAGVMTPGACQEVTTFLDRLPSDRDLFGGLESLVQEASSMNPDVSRIAEIQAHRAGYMAGVRATTGAAIRTLQQLRDTLPPDEGEELFYFDRCLRLIEQSVEFHSPDGLALRDQFLAENVAAIGNRHAGGRVVLALHNLHVARAPLTIRGEQFVPTGHLLAQRLAGGYRVLGSAFHQGTYLAAPGPQPGQSEIAAAHVPRSSTFEHVLRRFAVAEGMPDLLLDLCGQGAQDGPSPWPAEMEMRLGEAGSQQEYEQSFTRQDPCAQFDGLIFVSEAAPVALLPEYYERARVKWGNVGAS
jgi:erythromycin esterase